jgi:mannose-1-phosphate guanylyltransferase/mannose-1-phosphate guanylyltransferase/mannose-6-phosphate isomerase
MEGLSNFERDVRPWGEFERFTLNEQTTVKIISVKPNEAFSLQTHAHRKELWRILSGSGVVTIGETKTDAKPGSSFSIEPGIKHRAEGGPEGLQFLEIAFGEFDESDITRLEDKYGRT